MTSLSSDPAAQLLSANRAAAYANSPTTNPPARGEASGGGGYPAGGGPGVPSAGPTAHPASAIGPLSPGSVGGGVMPGHQAGSGCPQNTTGGGSQVAAGGGGNTWPAGGMALPSGLGQINGGSPEAQPSTGYELVSRTS
jgi:hypothetical protein